ncbi:MAG: GNAT family N-acetyltransferase [Emcibacteraceae bacterium]|nr:GNAT family N-acetyltransferase [Emcibacteraceae bacterium]
MTNITIRRSNTNDANTQTINRLVSLINQVYDQAEKGMWAIEGGRANAPDIEDFLKNGKLYLADYEGEIVGSVKIGEVDEHTFEFGMLVADPDHRNKGIGRQLVDIVEDHALNAGYKTIRLELLTPHEWVNPSKEFLKKWYSRRGYIPNKPVPFESLYPERKDHFACPCDFTVWLKELT